MAFLVKNSNNLASTTTRTTTHLSNDAGRAASETQTVTQIRNAAVADVKRSVEGASPTAMMKALKRCEDEAKAKEDNGDLKGAYVRLIQAGTLLHLVKESLEYKTEARKARHGPIYCAVLNYTVGGGFESYKHRVKSVKQRLLEQEARMAANSEAGHGTSREVHTRRNSGNGHIPQYLRSLQDTRLESAKHPPQLSRLPLRPPTPGRPGTPVSEQTPLLQVILEQAAATELSLRQKIESLKRSLAQTTANETSLKQKNDEHRNHLARTVSNEIALRREIKTLKESLTHLQQESENRQSLLVQAGSTELSLRQEIGALKESQTQTASKLREEMEVLKTTLTHALISEQEMRTSARQTREKWEEIEKSLREEIDALRVGPKIVSNDMQGKMVASGVQDNVRSVEDTTTLKQPRGFLEGSSDIHILFNDLALQGRAKDAPDTTPHSTSDAFGNRLLPEFTALERATQGLQHAVNSEVRSAYAREWSTSSPGSVLQSGTTVARNLRLLVVLWESSRVKELLASLPSVLEVPTPMMESEDCAICTDGLSPTNKIVVEGCGHAMCKGCLREYIGTRLEEKVWPIQCPICMTMGRRERRAQAITRVLVDELVLPPTVHSQWIDFELSQFVIPVTCPKCEKANLFELAEYNRSTILICNHGCQCAWCRNCSYKVNIEAPHSCEDAALEELAGERQWMRCPRPSCRIMVEKNLGCNHITCRCGMQFCYQCGEEYTGSVSQHACRKQS